MLLRVILASALLMAGAEASAWDFDFLSRAEARAAETPIEVGADCSFKDRGTARFMPNQYISHGIEGSPARDRGNARIGQRVVDLGGCREVEHLLFVDCNSGEAILLEGVDDPTTDIEIAGLTSGLIKFIQPPYGPILIKSDTTVDGLVLAAKEYGLRYDTDVIAFFAAVRKRDRFDYTCGCKLYYPDSVGAEMPKP
jgi:hypothetical protein